VLDQIGSALTIDSVVRTTALLWTLPASLLAIAGYRYVFDRPPAPLVAAYVEVARAAVPLLTAFTLLIGGIWLVRSGRWQRPARPGPLAWTVHVQFAAVGIVALGVAVEATGQAAVVLATLAAVSGFIGGMALPRWLLAVGARADRALAGWAVLTLGMVFETTLGWLHSSALIDGASFVSGALALVRGLLLLAAVIAVLVRVRPSSA